MLALLGSPVALTTAFVIEAGAAGIRAVGFLIPASLGVLEGGIVGLFGLLRMDPAAGLAFGVVRRIREAAWILAGTRASPSARETGRGARTRSLRSRARRAGPRFLPCGHEATR